MFEDIYPDCEWHDDYYALSSGFYDFLIRECDLDGDDVYMLMKGDQIWFAERYRGILEFQQAFLKSNKVNLQ